MPKPQSDSNEPDSSSDLTTGSIPKALLSMAGPMLIGLVSMTSMSVVDTYFVGQLGTLPLAALSFSFPVMFAASGVANGLSSAVQSAVSRAFGEDNLQKSNRLATHALLLTLAIVFLVVAAGFTFLRPTFLLLGASAELMPLIEGYMTIWFFSLIFFVIPIVGGAALMARGNAVAPMCFMVGGAILNAVFDPILIFGLAGAPEMGIEGAALASALSRGMITVATILVLLSNEIVAIQPEEVLSRVVESLSQLLRLGVPATGRALLIPATLAVLTRLVSKFGEPAVAAYGAGTRIEALATLVFGALSIGLTPVVGQNWGAGLRDRTVHALTSSQLICFIWGVGICAVMFLGAPWIANSFVDSPQTAQHLSLFLTLVPVGYAGLGIFIVGNAALNAIDRPYIAAALAVSRTFVLIIPCAWLLSTRFGVSGIFGTLAAMNLLIGLVSFSVTRYLLQTLPVGD